MFQMFAVYDTKAEAYLLPFFCQTKGQALRSFDDAVNSQDHQFNRHAKDYTLFHLGSYDEQTGEIVPFAKAMALVNALEVLAKKAHGPVNGSVNPGPEPSDVAAAAARAAH